MSALTIIAGIILMIAGVSCMMTPVATFMSAGYYVGCLLLVYGIAGIIKAFQRRSLVIEIILSVLAIVVGVSSIVKPGSSLAFDKLALLVISCWFIVQGVLTVYTSVKLKAFNAFWILSAIVGVLSIALGAYSLIHPMVMAMTAGYLIGFYFIEAGLNMIILAATASSIKGQVKTIEREIDDMADYMKNQMTNQMTDEMPDQTPDQTTDQTTDRMTDEMTDQ